MLDTDPTDSEMLDAAVELLRDAGPYREMLRAALDIQHQTYRLLMRQREQLIAQRDELRRYVSAQMGGNDVA